MLITQGFLDGSILTDGLLGGDYIPSVIDTVPYPSIVFKVSIPLNLDSFSPNSVNQTTIFVETVGTFKNGDTFLLSGEQAMYIKKLYVDNLKLLIIISIV